MGRRRRNRIIQTIGFGASGGILAFMILLAMLVIVVPLVTGSAPITVLTGSMQPKLPPGTLIVVKPTPVEEIRVGDVLTYQLRSGEPELVTHRVVQRIASSNGEIEFVTQGDANSAPDPKAVREVQVRGTVWYSIPLLGWVNTWLTGERRAVVVPVLAGLLFVYAGWMIYSGLRDGRRRRERARSEEAAAEQAAARAETTRIAGEADVPPLLLR